MAATLNALQVLAATNPAPFRCAFVTYLLQMFVMRAHVGIREPVVHSSPRQHVACGAQLGVGWLVGRAAATLNALQVLAATNLAPFRSNKTLNHVFSRSPVHVC
jgi:predicted RNA-binding protein Jag